MKRDFAQDYKEYCDQSTPDLWERIEAALPEKTQETATVATTNTQKKKVINRQHLFTAAGLIAACLCLVVSIPLFQLTRGSDNNNEMQFSGQALMGDFAESAVEESEAEESARATDMVTEDAAEGASEESLEEAFDLTVGAAVAEEENTIQDNAILGNGIQENAIQDNGVQTILVGTIVAEEYVTLSDGIQYVSATFHGVRQTVADAELHTSDLDIQESGTQETEAPDSTTQQSETVTMEILVSVDSLQAAGLLTAADGNDALQSVPNETGWQVQLRYREMQVEGELGQYDIGQSYTGELQYE